MKRALLLLLVCSLSISCVTTRRVDEYRSPDPRDDLPELSGDESKALAMAQREKLASSKPLTTVIDPAPRMRSEREAIQSDPLVNVRVVFLVGSADDPEGKEGLAALSVKLMRQATQKLSASELSDALFPWAAELDVQSGKDTVTFLGRVHGDHVEAFTELLLDVILRPRLDKSDFERVKAEQKSFIETTLRAGNDELLQREALEVLIYAGPKGDGAHPYRTTPAGTVAGIDAITLDDVKQFASTSLARDRLVLGISGGASPRVIEKLKKGLETLPFASAERERPAAPAAPQTNVALLVDKPAAGSAISLGFAVPELNRAHPDYAAMKLAETWFGEHRNLIGHLFDSMREKRGLNYGDYAYVEHFVQEGWSSYEQLNITRRTQYFSMWIRPVEHKNRLFALRQAAWELDKFVKDGIPDDESFKKVQSFVQGYWRAKEQEPMRALGYRVDQLITGQPFDRQGLRDKVRTLTRADVNAAIKRHLRADKLAIVVVTQDAKALADEIAKKTPSPITYAAPKIPEAQLAEDKIIEVFDLGLAAERVFVVAPTALFAK